MHLKRRASNSMICKHPGNPLLHKGIVGMRFLLFGGKFVSLAADKVKYGSVHTISR